MIWPHGLLPREYANILDYGAEPVDPSNPSPVDSTDAILRAIATGLQVLVPSGEYFVSEEIHFGKLAPGCTFLGEGRIRLNSASARIRITGRHQVFDGMWITTGAFDFQPCVLVEGAEDLTFAGLRIACATDSTLLQLQDCSEIRLCGGHISGVNEYGYNTGILFCGVRGFGARGVSIDQLEHGIVFEADRENHCVAFQDGTTEACFENMVEVRGAVYGLSMIGWHMESGTDDGFNATTGALESRAGAAVFIRVLEGGGVYGGVFAGSEFGSQRAKADGVPHRLFAIAGDWHGVSVYGCWHNGGLSDTFETASIWELESTASASNCCDFFNSWDHALVLEDPTRMAAILYDPDSLNQLGLRISGAGLRIAASKIGFFDAKPVEQPTYTLAREYDQRNVGATTLEAVLGTLLQDLALLGLVKVSYT